MAALSLQVFIPSRHGDPEQVTVPGDVAGCDLRVHVAGLSGMDASSISLLVRNCTGNDPMFRLDDAKSLLEQGLTDGALVSFIVSDEAEAPSMIDADDNSALFRGFTNHVVSSGTTGRFDPPKRNTQRTPAEQGVRSCPSQSPSPPLNSEWETNSDDDGDEHFQDIQHAARVGASSLVETVFGSLRAFDSPGGDCSDSDEGYAEDCRDLDAPLSREALGLIRNISVYSWSDRGKYVKVYIAADSEPDVVNAAAIGAVASDPLSAVNAIAPADCLDARFTELDVILTVWGQGLRHVLELRGLCRPIRPKDSRCMVQPGKRVILELRKVTESEHWDTLLHQGTG